MAILAQIVTRQDELPLDQVLLVSLAIAVLLTVTIMLKAIGDLIRAIRRGVEHDPDVTAATWAMFTLGARLLMLLAVLTLVLVRIQDPLITSFWLFWSLLSIIVLLCVNSLADPIFRARIMAQSELIQDPCATCPIDNAPYKSRAIEARTKTVVHTPVADVELLISPPPEEKNE